MQGFGLLSHQREVFHSLNTVMSLITSVFWGCFILLVIFSDFGCVYTLRLCYMNWPYVGSGTVKIRPLLHFKTRCCERQSHPALCFCV